MHKKSSKNYGLYNANFYACNNITYWRKYVLVKRTIHSSFFSAYTYKIDHLEIEIVYLVMNILFYICTIATMLKEKAITSAITKLVYCFC